MFHYNQRQLNIPTNSLTTMDNNYDEAFSKTANKKLSVLQEPDIKYTEFVHYLAVNSADRPSNQALQFDFYVKLQTVYKNVSRVELISAILPNTADIIDEPYLVLDIEELNTIDFTNINNVHRGFSVLTLKNPNQGAGQGGFVLVELGTVFQTKIRDYTGAIYDFGTANGSTDKANQVSFILKITTQEVDRTGLELRNVY